MYTKFLSVSKSDIETMWKKAHRQKTPFPHSRQNLDRALQIELGGQKKKMKENSK